MNLTPFHSRASGFTLLEVLAAIALLAFAFAIGLRAMSGALSNAVLQAQSLLDAQGLTAPLRAGLRHGSFVDGATWQLRASVYTPPSSPPAAGFAAPPAQSFGGGIDLYRLDLDVHYGGSGARALRFSTMRAQLMQGARQP